MRAPAPYKYCICQYTNLNGSFFYKENHSHTCIRNADVVSNSLSHPYQMYCSAHMFNIISVLADQLSYIFVKTTPTVHAIKQILLLCNVSTHAGEEMQLILGILEFDASHSI